MRHRREHGTLSTGELKTTLYTRCGGSYRGKTSLWEGVTRYDDELPDFQKAGNGDYAVGERLDNPA